MEPSFKFSLFTSNSLASAQIADIVYDTLSNWQFSPESFGDSEPISVAWPQQETFAEMWARQSQQYFGQVLVQRHRAPSYFADITFQFGPDRILDKKPPCHTVSLFGMKESETTPEIQERLVELCDALFQQLDFEYGFLCLDDEYDAKNIRKNWRHPDGTIEPRKVVGMRWPYCIPALYWINYFGSQYLDQGFAAPLSQLTRGEVATLQNGIRFQTDVNPRFFESDGASQAEAECRMSLGEEWFYSDDMNECRRLTTNLASLRAP